MPDYAAYDTFVAAWGARMDELPAEIEKRAADATWGKQPVPKTTLDELLETVEPEKDFHFLFRSIASNVEPFPAGARPYTALSRYRVKRGEGNELEKLRGKYNMPLLDKLLADGAVLGHGLLVESANSLERGWRWECVRTADILPVTKSLLRSGLIATAAHRRTLRWSSDNS